MTENSNKGRLHWPRFDLWLLLMIVLAGALIMIATFDLWVPHGLPPLK